MEIREIEIPDYGVLKVSEYGDIYGIHDYNKKRNPTPDKNGYFRLTCKYRHPHIDENGIEKKYIVFFVHRLVAMCFLDNPNNYPVINHKDGNKQNNHYTNLEWCTVQQNHDHAVMHNLDKGIEGEKNPKCKLSKQDVLDIRSKYKESKDKGYKFYDKYALIYNVDRESIRHICKNITWKNI